jgi:hypothetical protein
MNEFTEGDGLFHCRDCGVRITLEQYRRKVPRCDDCEATDVIERWWSTPRTPESP